MAIICIHVPFMSIFSFNNSVSFNQAKWETDKSSFLQGKMNTILTADEIEGEIRAATLHGYEYTSYKEDNPDQFVILQLDDDPEKRVMNTSEIKPVLTGEESKPDINLWLDFEGFKINDQERIEKSSKATLQLVVGQEKRLSGLDKLFYCISGGLDLYSEFNNKPTESKDFRKKTEEALGRKPISLPAGEGQITFTVVKHEEQPWWKQVFSFAKSDGAKDLFSLIGFAGITEKAVSTLGSMLDTLFTKEPEVLFRSIPIKLAFTESARQEMGGGLSTSYVSCLNPGFWVMARRSDYEKILSLKPIYYQGFGVLAPDGCSQNDALSSDNPFSEITYAIIRARMKEVDLKQNIL